MMLENPYYSQNSVAEFCDSTLSIYLRWSKEHFHFGFWDNTTKSLEEALENTVKFVMEKITINSDDIILDAGCGIGGSSRYIVSQLAAKTIGITISSQHLNKAKLLSKKVRNRKFLEFYNQDFTQTNFPNEFFTKIIAIESVCHTQHKSAFITEAYRLLQQGGKLAVIDAFKIRNNLTPEEKKIYTAVLEGWALPNIDLKEDFAQKMTQTGFKNVIYLDKRRDIEISSWLIHRIGKFWWPITLIFFKLQVIPILWYRNNLASYYQKKCFDQKIATYGVFLAEK